MRSGASFDACVEQIDVGGPTMIRAAAKNHAYVTVVTSPTQYDDVVANMAANGGGTDYLLRQRLAAEAFAATAVRAQEYAACSVVLSLTAALFGRPSETNTVTRTTVLSSRNAQQSMVTASHNTLTRLSCVVPWWMCNSPYQAYDSAIGAWFKVQTTAAAPAAVPPQSPSHPDPVDVREYSKSIPLKYGCNPHQKPAYVGTINGTCRTVAAAVAVTELTTSAKLTLKCEEWRGRREREEEEEEEEQQQQQQQ